MYIFPECTSIPEYEQPQTEVFFLDSLTVRCNSTDANALEYCHTYFDVYAHGEQQIGKPTWTITETIDDSVPSAVWAVNHDKNTIALTRPSTDTKRIIRLIRALMMYKDAEDDKVMFKAASFVKGNGKNLVLIGDEAAGKTSILLDYLLNHELGGKFVSNSHVSLKLKDGIPHAYGYPMAVGVRLHVLAAMQEKGSAHVGPLHDELAQKQSGEDDRFYLDPHELQNHLELLQPGQSKLGALVIVQSIPLDQKPSLRRVETDEVLTYFEDYFMKYQDHEPSCWNQLLEVPAIDQRHLIKDILDATPIYIMSYSVGNTEETITLLEEL